MTIILEENDVHVEYDEKDLALYIYCGKLNLTDGWHRLRGFFKALFKKPDLDYLEGVMITCFDVEKAVKFIYQEQNHNFEIPKRNIRKSWKGSAGQWLEERWT